MAKNNKDKNSNKAGFNWFPGHMAKTERKLKENLKFVDFVVEITDARIPQSSGNPDLKEIIGEKPRIIILNKTDLADDNQTYAWSEFYKSQDVRCVPFSLKKKESAERFFNCALSLMKQKIDSWNSKGIINRKLRAMVVGIPNVGKSSFINRLTGKSCAKVENRPGVTRRIQWFSAGDKIEFLDTPGVLWPKFESEEIACNLAFTGAIKDQILDIEDLAVKFIEEIRSLYLKNLCDRFKLDLQIAESLSSFEILKDIALKRGMLLSGAQADTLRASALLLEEFRSGKLGKITLELPY